MPRHETFTLDPETADVAAENRRVLMMAVSEGVPVMFTYRKRDTGETSVRSGECVAFTGTPGMSNEAMLMETEDGTRTFNVWLMRSVSIVEA
jgi:hypothetical protein